MSKIGNYRVGAQETDHYRLGWESAERGEPYPEWDKSCPRDITPLINQRCGWNDYHAEQVQP